MNRNIIYFINPISGTKNKDALLQLIEKKTREQKIPFQVLHTNASGDYYYLKEKIQKEGITDIIICGGDGSVNQVAGSLLGIRINIGIIPMGSGNGLAFAAGIPSKAAKAVDIIFNGKASYIDGFYINESFSCMLCGLGFDAQVAHDFSIHPSRGLTTYVKLTIRNFIKARFYPFTITANNTTIQTNALFISIANSNQFGNNFTIAPKASLNDGLLDIVVVNKMNKLKMLFYILKQIRVGKAELISGKKIQHQGIQYFQAKNIVIKNPSVAPLHIDGEPAETSTELNIKIIENAFRLIQP